MDAHVTFVRSGANNDVLLNSLNHIEQANPGYFPGNADNAADANPAANNNPAAAVNPAADAGLIDINDQNGENQNGNNQNVNNQNVDNNDGNNYDGDINNGD